MPLETTSQPSQVTLQQGQGPREARKLQKSLICSGSYAEDSRPVVSLDISTEIREPGINLFSSWPAPVLAQQICGILGLCLALQFPPALALACFSGDRCVRRRDEARNRLRQLAGKRSERDRKIFLLLGLSRLPLPSWAQRCPLFRAAVCYGKGSALLKLFEAPWSVDRREFVARQRHLNLA